MTKAGFTGKITTTFSLSSLAEESISLGGKGAFGGLGDAIAEAQQLQANIAAEKSIIDTVRKGAAEEIGGHATTIAQSRGKDSGRSV